MTSTATPGVALRLTAAAGAVASLLAVVSGATGAGAPHRELAALALPPLLALVLAAWFAHRRLLAPALVALLLFVAAAAGRAARRTSHSPHSRLRQRSCSPRRRCGETLGSVEPFATTSR